MSEKANMRRKNLRWQLLASASAAALMVYVYGSGEAFAADDDSTRPLVWIELGGQLDRLSDPQEKSAPPFLASITQKNLLSALDIQSPPSYAIDGEGKISFQPEDSNWIFSASIRYGRSQAVRHRHQQTENAVIPKYQFTFFGVQFGKLITAYQPNGYVKFADGRTSQSEHHVILDFQAGKDVGLGMFGREGSSVLSGGVRIAQFTSKTSVKLQAVPDLQYPTAPIASVAGWQAFKSYSYPHFHTYALTADNARSFRGVGPSVSWDASIPFAGNSENGELSLDWGANAAFLFGRQTARGSHHTKARGLYGGHWMTPAALINLNDGSVHKGNFFGSYKGRFQSSASTNVLYDRSVPFNRVRSVTVPNLGGFAGMSFRYSNAKISFGYRADEFFGAMDGGQDTAKRENRGFYGPYLNLSLGFGG